MPRLLTDAEIEGCLVKLDRWKREGNFITKVFEFEKFNQGIRFVNKVAKVAEEQEHHPDINIRYTQVKLSIQTHSEGGLTAWDFGLAHEIDKLTPA